MKNFHLQSEMFISDSSTYIILAIGNPVLIANIIITFKIVERVQVALKIHVLHIALHNRVGPYYVSMRSGLTNKESL